MTDHNIYSESNSESLTIFGQYNIQEPPLPNYISNCDKSQNISENNNTFENAYSTNFTNNESDIYSDQEENKSIDKNLYYIETPNINESNGDERIENNNLNVEGNLSANNLNNNMDENNDNRGIKEHDKNSEDNIINRIKTNFFNTSMIDLVNKSSLNKNIYLKKLPTKEFISDVSKINNERLFDMKMKDILCEQQISTKYSTLNRFENKKIIEKIYKEKKEINVIKILELTFEELFIIYRRSLKDPEDMEKLEKIKAKIERLDFLEGKNKLKDFEDLIEDLRNKYHDEEYIEKVKNICLGYKNWFNDKKERKLN